MDLFNKDGVDYVKVSDAIDWMKKQRNDIPATGEEMASGFKYTLYPEPELYQYYVTFGQLHTHTVGDLLCVDNTCVALITSTEKDPCVAAKKLFGYLFSNSYTTEEFDAVVNMEYYPRGIVRYN